MNDVVLEINQVSKVYHLYDRPLDRLLESLLPGGRLRHRDRYALNNISFTVRQGEIMGIIGVNGSGKSTILKIITGVLSQTSGDVRVQGRVSALLELGTGFNPGYTGRENVYVSGMMMGYSRDEVTERLDDIRDFADIGAYFDQPVKTYSSGMFARLAFAVAINVDPDI
ncbi:MAG: ABC transporter ATP-binding protein, partial [Clostridiaceae bacterium]|nr:ABC transporter ATP-binding protein [Clostridiaceae bacterium]